MTPHGSGAGRFFETLIGVRKEPLKELLAKLGVIYIMEPTLTVLFVTNMVHVWENVMANLRSQVFRRILIQKVTQHATSTTLYMSQMYPRIDFISLEQGYSRSPFRSMICVLTLFKQALLILLVFS